MGTFANIVAGAITGLLVANCSLTDPTVLGKVRGEQTFAMVGQERRTDQNLIDIFKQTNTIIIKSGRGGDLDGMIRTLRYLDVHPHKTIVIDGECASACTLLLSRPQNVVFTERAKFLFHSAYVVECIDGFQHNRMAQLGNDRMMSEFDDGIQNWIRQTLAYSSVSFSYMSYEEAAYYRPTMAINSANLPKMEIKVAARVLTDTMPSAPPLLTCE